MVLSPVAVLWSPRPTEESQLRYCHECGTAVWALPSACALIGDGALLMCLPCGRKDIRARAEADPNYGLAPVKDFVEQLGPELGPQVWEHLGRWVADPRLN